MQISDGYGTSIDDVQKFKIFPPLNEEGNNSSLTDRPPKVGKFRKNRNFLSSSIPDEKQELFSKVPFFFLSGTEVPQFQFRSP